MFGLPCLAFISVRCRFFILLQVLHGGNGADSMGTAGAEGVSASRNCVSAAGPCSGLRLPLARCRWGLLQIGISVIPGFDLWGRPLTSRSYAPPPISSALQGKYTVDPHLVNTLLALVHDLGGLDARLAGSLADATTLRFSLGSTSMVAFSDGTNTEILVTVSLVAGACGCVVEMPHLRLQTRMSSSSVTTFVTPHAGNVDMDFQGSPTVRWPKGTFTGGDIWFSPTASMLARATLSLAASVIDVLLSLAMMSRTHSPSSPSSLSSRSSPSSSTDSWRSGLPLDSDSLSLVTSGPNLEP